MSAQQPLVLFSYASSPYGQKFHLLLTAAGISYSELPQPAVLPRPDLEALGVTYRRIPVLAVGRDVYADSSAFIDVILNQLGGRDKIITSKADKAFETWGNDTFKSIMPLLPAQAVNDAKFAKDRATIFPIIAKPELLQSLQPTALADLKSRMTTIEDVFLADGPYIGGDKISVADVHVIWVIRWVLLGLGAAKRFPGLDKSAFPKVWNLIASLPKPKYDTLDKDTATKTIKDAKLSSTNVRVMQGESSGIAQDAAVIVESADTKPGAHPQKGKLIGTTAQEIILGLESGVQLHFPRQGYILREASDFKL